MHRSPGEPYDNDRHLIFACLFDGLQDLRRVGGDDDDDDDGS